MSSVSENPGSTGSQVWDGGEVCVVGAGPAGLSVAQALGRAGLGVTLLESGSSHASVLAQDLNDGEVRGEPYAGLQRTRHRGVGGTPNVWDVEVGHQPGAKYAPLSPRDLEGWPLDWNDLEPHYREAQEVCGLGPFEYGAEAWASEGRRPFDLRGTGLSSAVYQFGLADRFRREIVGELEGMESVSILPSATVVGLALDPSGGRVAGVEVVRDSGDSLRVRARRFVLACGAIENARLLLLARLDERAPSPWLGRGFMEHARDFSLALVPQSPRTFAEAAFYDLHTSPEGFQVGGRLTLSDDALRDPGLPNASITLIPRAERPKRRSILARLLRHRPPVRSSRYGWSEIPNPSRAFDRFDMVVNVEQRPDPENRIELGGRPDRFANPLPRLHLAWTPGDQARLERLREHLAEGFRDAGLGRLRFQPGRRPDLSAHHHAGTTRMAYGPEDGVVDLHGRVFGVENLYVTGGSVFPTAGFANPTLTIVALARRLARHLASKGGE